MMNPCPAPGTIAAAVFTALSVLAPPCGPPTFTVRQVSQKDCVVENCVGHVKNGDCTIDTGWAADGRLYGTQNDSNIYYNPAQLGEPGYTGPNCSGGNVVWMEIVNGSFFTSNCMFSLGAMDTKWDPAPVGTCSAGYWNDCDWKSHGPIFVDGVGYLNVYRQQRAGSGAWTGHDGTLIKTTDGGKTWLNPAHVGGTPNPNGDAPAGPGDPTYPRSILWPDPPSHNGADQHAARLEFIQYGQDGKPWPAVDRNDKYVYALTYNGDFTKYYLMRGVRANLPKLSASDWSHYRCPTYATAVCDGLDDANWTQTMGEGTDFGSVYPGLGSMFYNAELGTYIAIGGNVGPVPFYTTPHPWGPWAKSAANADGEYLGFLGAMLSSVKVMAPGVVQFTAAATYYNHDSAGTPGYVTYEVTRH